MDINTNNLLVISKAQSLKIFWFLFLRKWLLFCHSQLDWESQSIAKIKSF